MKQLLHYILIPVFALLLIIDGYARDAVITATPLHNVYGAALWVGFFMAVVWAGFKSTAATIIAGMCVILFFLDYYRDTLPPYVLAFAYLVFGLTVAQAVAKRFN